MAEICRDHEPSECLDRIFWHAVAPGIHQAEQVLGVRQTLFGGALAPEGGLRQIGQGLEDNVMRKEPRSRRKKLGIARFDGKGIDVIAQDASVYLINPQGGFEGTIAYGENQETALGKIRKLLDKA